jgi:integrase
MHSNGDRASVLFWTQPFQPALLPFLWVTLDRRSKAGSTVDKDNRLLKEFYDYCQEVAFNLESAIFDIDFASILDAYNRFGFWIKSKRKQSQIDEHTDANYLESMDDYLSAGVVNSHLSTAKTFIAWSIDRYSTKTEDTEQLYLIKQRKDALIDQLERIFASHVLPNKSKDTCDGIEPGQVERIREFIHPDNPSNPYPHNARHRNNCAFNTFAETGVRRSELMKIQTSDIRKVNGRCFISIVDRTGDISDTRIFEPGFKTLPRTIEISNDLYDQLDDYIDLFRRPVNSDGKYTKLTHKYLFVNYLGDPLSATSVNQIFIPLKDLINEPELSPHKLRNTFANDFLEFLVETMKMPLDAALDKLRYLGGWSPNSPMPQKYGRRYIAKLANKMNQERVHSAWERTRQYA